MDKRAEDYRLLLGLNESWLVQDVDLDLDLAGQKVTIPLPRNRDVAALAVLSE